MIDRKVLPLAIGGLGIGTTEFTIMGLLPDIAQSIGVSIPEAGHFISAYALGVVIGAPLLIGYTIKYPPKKVLIALMILFTIFNALSAVVSSYPLMMLARFLSGLPHGAFFGVGAVVASRLATKGKEARYISMMFSGLTIANLAVVPLITYIGHEFSWRWYFFTVAMIGLITIVCIYKYLPNMENTGDTSFKGKLNFLKTGPSWFILSITGIGFGGLFAWLSYINPLMTQVSGFSAQNMAWIMVLVGAGMVLGNLLGGLLSDRIGPARTTFTLLTALMFCLLAIFFFSEDKTTSLILTFICGGLSMSMGAPISMLMIRSAPGSEMMANAFMQAGFNVANSAGAFFGGIPLIFGLSYNYPSLVGAFMSLLGLFICFMFIMRYQRSKLKHMIKQSFRSNKA